MFACRATVFGIFCWVLLASPVFSAAIDIPNGSFESPYVAMAPPYATASISDWQKGAVPDWWLAEGYSTQQWINTAGVFVDVPFKPIDNVDGRQAAFMFSPPDCELYQDLIATYAAGRSYHLTVGIEGGGYGMQIGVPMEIRLFYRDAENNRVTIGATVVTNTNGTGVLSHLTDYQLDIPAVAASDPWAGKNIGVQLISTATLADAGGYWDIDNVRLMATGLVGWKGGSSLGPTDWAVGANWDSGPDAPNGPGIEVGFGNQTTDNSVVDMISQGQTVGAITFAAATSTTIQSFGGYSLTLDNNGMTSTIGIEGNHTISALVELKNDAIISGAGILNCNGGINGNYTLDVVSGTLNASSIHVDTLVIGNVGGAQAVPEPSGFALLLSLAIGGLLCRRCRS